MELPDPRQKLFTRHVTKGAGAVADNTMPQSVHSSKKGTEKRGEKKRYGKKPSGQ